MLLTPWSDRDQADYIAQMSALLPDEIQLNTPTRPKPRQHQLDARSNHLPASSNAVQWLKPVRVDVLQTFGDRIQATLGVPVRYPHTLDH